MDAALREVVSEILDVPPHSIDDALTPNDVPLWDSLTHLRMISAVEQRFGVRFRMAEIQSVTCIGALRALLARYGQA